MDKQELIEELAKLKEAYEDFLSVKMADLNRTNPNEYVEKRNKAMNMSIPTAKLLENVERFGDDEMKEIAAEWERKNFILVQDVMSKKVSVDLMALLVLAGIIASVVGLVMYLI